MRLWKEFKERGYEVREILLRLGKIDGPSIDPLEICTLLGVQVYSAVFSDNIDSELKWEDGHPCIFVNDLKPNRQRYLIAYELGHLFVGSHKDRCNAFAADLLMPSWILKSACLRYGKDIETLAKVFGVSEHAMAVRLDVIGIR
jgi:Zn-dependent peptidase ImmA (M78 family)